MTELSTILLSVIGTIAPLLGGGVLLYRRQNRKIKDAEARLAEVNVRNAEIEAKDKEREYNDRRVDDLHAAISKLNEHLKEVVTSEIEKDRTIEDKTRRIRETEDRLIVTERKNTQLAEKIGDLKAEFAEKKCKWLDCELREPPTARTKAAIKKKEEKEAKAKAEAEAAARKEADAKEKGGGNG